MSYTFEESVDGKGGGAVIPVIVFKLTISPDGAPPMIFEGWGSTYELARLSAYVKATLALCDASFP